MWVLSGLWIGVMCCYATGQQVKTFEQCLTSTTIHEITYTCDPNEMIHVISALYRKATTDCQPVDGGCEVKLENLGDGFLTECNGHETCTEDISDFLLQKQCGNITEYVATISYECESDRPINVCDDTIVTTSLTNTLYLTSPNYPRSDGTDSPCVCNVTGTDMSVQILEIYFSYDLSLRADLTLTGETNNWTSHPSTFLAYNNHIFNNANTLKVMFDAHGRTRQEMWIRITGTSPLTLICNSGTRTASLPTPISATTSPSTVASTSSQNLDTVTIGVLCSVNVLVLLCVTTLLVYLKYIKPRRLSKAGESTETAKLQYDDVILNHHATQP